MQSTSDLLLAIYEQARKSSTNEFINSAFKDLQRTLKFDSAGIVSLGYSNTNDIQIKGAFAYNFSPEEKYKVRTELGISEKYVQGRGIVGSDPLLEKCFRNKNRSQIIDSRTVSDQRVVEYGRRTGAIHVLTIVTDDIHGGGFYALSLWRGNADQHYTEDDQVIADATLPHLFMALNINIRLANVQELFEKEYFPPIICGLNGFLNFADDAVFTYLRIQFPDWTGIFLPKIMLDGLREDSSGIYVADGFIAKARIRDGTLLVFISKKSETGSLTKIEFKIAEMLAMDHTYKDIALQLAKSPATVRNQARSIYQKLGISKKSSIRAALLLQER